MTPYGKCRGCGRFDVTFSYTEGYMRQKCNKCRGKNMPTIYPRWDKLPKVVLTIKEQIDEYFETIYGATV